MATAHERPIWRFAFSEGEWPRWRDYGVSALLVLQVLHTFVVRPLAVVYPAWHGLGHFGSLLVAAVCAVLLTRKHSVRIALLLGVLVLAVAPVVHRGGVAAGYDDLRWREAGAAVAFCFNFLVTVLVGLHSFGPGRVTTQRIQGAVLVYLNVAVLFAIAFGFLETYSPGSIQSANGEPIASVADIREADLTYFSLATVTTAGYGDIIPVHPLARSLANLEALFGQLFPATLLARLVALHLAHNRATKANEDEAAGHDAPQ